MKGLILQNILKRFFCFILSFSFLFTTYVYADDSDEPQFLPSDYSFASIYQSLHNIFVYYGDITLESYRQICGIPDYLYEVLYSSDSSDSAIDAAFASAASSVQENLASTIIYLDSGGAFVRYFRTYFGTTLSGFNTVVSDDTGKYESCIVVKNNLAGQSCFVKPGFSKLDLNFPYAAEVRFGHIASASDSCTITSSISNEGVWQSSGTSHYSGVQSLSYQFTGQGPYSIYGAMFLDMRPVLFENLPAQRIGPVKWPSLYSNGTVYPEVSFVDEDDRTIFNPVTNEYYDFSTMSYDYDDHSYKFYDDSSLIGSLSFGSDEITFVQGDTTYVYNYVINNSGSSGGGSSSDSSIDWISFASLILEAIKTVCSGIVKLTIGSIDALTGIVSDTSSFFDSFAASDQGDIFAMFEEGSEANVV